MRIPLAVGCIGNHRDGRQLLLNPGSAMSIYPVMVDLEIWF
ncbi:hypothetical protein [Nocardia noduli]|nr:hypothetical protein [Nocardia noduli]